MEKFTTLTSKVEVWRWRQSIPSNIHKFLHDPSATYPRSQYSLL